MTEFAVLLAMSCAGGLLAAVWLAGLWFDVRSLGRSRHRPLRLLVGALGRLSLVACGFALIVTLDGHWSHVLAALAGFLIVRYLVIQRVGSRQSRASDVNGGAT